MAPSQDVGPARSVWGIQSAIGSDSLGKKFALLAGSVYVGIGVIGFFFTGFSNFTESTGTELFGIFHLTPFHNIIHLGVGALWLIAALTLSPRATSGVNIGIAGVYVVAAVVGYLGALEFLGIRPGFGDADFYLHLLTGVVTLLVGLIPTRD
ncbi:MAG: DUF4383 domain-containing protein [Actinomycetota bacterium]|nr:DUF4383 domain-containing protein [Actinomycetota bacterium]